MDARPMDINGPQNIEDRIFVQQNQGLAEEIHASLKRLQRFWPEAPEAMGYFFDLFCHWENPVENLRRDRPVIGLTCMQTPLELVLAVGAAPFRLCNGSHVLDQAGGEILPAKTCALVKSSIGLLAMFRQDLTKRLAMVVVPTTCDQKHKAGEIVQTMGFNFYSLEAPPSKHSEEARFYWQNSLKQWILALEKATRRRITPRRLKTAIFKLQLASQQFRRLARLQQHTPSLLPGTAMFLVINAFLWDDVARWTAAVEQLNDALEQRWTRGLPGDGNGARLLLTGSPPGSPGLKLPLLLEEAGARIVADQVCSCSKILHDTVVSGEGRLYDMLPAVADRYLRPCTCPFLDSSQDHARNLLNLARRFKIDGIVFSAYSGCHFYQMEQDTVRNILRDADFPMLFVESDFGTEDRGQLDTRIEAFLESIHARNCSCNF